jgi:hypothetical protein
VAIRGLDPLKEQIVTTRQEAQQILMAVFLVPSMLHGPFPADAVDSGLTKWEIRVYDRIPTSWI